MRRYLLPFVLAVAVLQSGIGAAENPVEPGLTSRIAVLALSGLPESTRSKLPGNGLGVLERLQSLPVIASDNSAEQLVSIFTQVKGNVASPELLAAAARCVVALSFSGEPTEAWTAFKTSVALRTVTSDISPAKPATVSNPAEYAQGLRKASEALRAQALAATEQSDQERLLALRTQTASAAVRSVSEVWTTLLDIQEAPSSDQTSDQPAGPVTQASVNSPKAETAKVDTGAAATGPIICNKSSKKFHRETCRFLPSPSNQLRLANRQEAIRQGYEACKVCKP